VSDNVRENWGEAFAPRPVRLETDYAIRLQTLGALADFKLDRLTFRQVAVTVALNGGEMYEYILAALALDKAESLAGVKPLYCSLFSHLSVSLYF
jgi:hypothetical protein